MQNVRAYSTVDVGSDHRMVSAAKIKISLRAPINNKHKRPKYDWRKLKDDEGLRLEYSIAVKNRFSALSIADDDTQTKYNNFVSAVEEAALNTVGLVKRKQPKNWVSSETVELLKERNAARRKRQADKQQQLSQDLLESYNEDRNQFLKEKLTRHTEAAKANQLRTTWEVVNEIAGKTKSANKHKMKRADGTNITSPKELLNEWHGYFKALLNNEKVGEPWQVEPASTDLNINTEAFTLEEVKCAVHDLKRGKSAGCDYGITPEALQFGGDYVIQQLCDICNDVYANGKAPEQFTTNLIVPLPKKGDLITHER